MKHLLILLACAGVPALPLCSQTTNPAETRQDQLLNEAVRGQGLSAIQQALREDAGIITKKIPWARLQVGLLQDFQYESNANFEGNSGDGAFSYSPLVFAAADARLNDQWRLTGLAQWTSTWYAGADDQDFWGLSGSALLNYRPAQSWPEFFAGSELNRYESWDDGSEISKSVAAVAGLRNTVRLTDTTGLFYHMRYSHRWSDPALFDRDQFLATVGLNQRLAPGLFLQPSYSFGYYDYVRPFGPRDTDRVDLRHEIALSLVYRVNPYLNLRLSGSFVDNDSTFSEANYQNFSTGLNSGLVYSF